MNAIQALDRVFSPVARCFTPSVAKKIVGLRSDPDLSARLEVLSEKANEGALTPNERAEYESYVRGIDLIAILQSKARRFLAQSKKTV